MLTALKDMFIFQLTHIKVMENFRNKAQENLALDGGGHLTYLAPTRVNLALSEERYPDIHFRSTREH